MIKLITNFNYIFLINCICLLPPESSQQSSFACVYFTVAKETNARSFLIQPVDGTVLRFCYKIYTVFPCSVSFFSLGYDAVKCITAIYKRVYSRLIKVYTFFWAKNVPVGQILNCITVSLHLIDVSTHPSAAAARRCAWRHLNTFHPFMFSSRETSITLLFLLHCQLFFFFFLSVCDMCL